MLPVLGKKAVLEWCMKEGLIGSLYVCPKCGKSMELRERTGKKICHVLYINACCTENINCKYYFEVFLNVTMGNSSSNKRDRAHSSDSECSASPCKDKIFEFGFGNRKEKFIYQPSLEECDDISGVLKAVEKMRLELASLVCVYDGRYTEARYPVSDEAFCHCFSGDIADKNDLRSSGEAINACQQGRGSHQMV
ncbi:5'-AMP-activated protein kinase subunit beta-1 [Trichonephila clavipes]|nr:5'-AMP-activated protein kinase subunit beta-1 [Trichonephila clavipes]